MTKSRDILKGKVKRVLRELEDMGQLCDPAVEHCVSALEAFVHDLATRMKSYAETTGVAVLTPIELKRSVVASPDLAFLHAKMAAIDEADAKYHKPQRSASQPRKRKAAFPATTATDDSTIQKEEPTKKKTKKTCMAGKGSANKTAKAKDHPPTTTGDVETKTTTTPAAAAIAEIDEDDNYDSSDSDQ